MYFCINRDSLHVVLGFERINIFDLIWFDLLSPWSTFFGGLANLISSSRIVKHHEANEF